jgi:P27 family predicted phage terminase small subunit
MPAHRVSEELHELRGTESKANEAPAVVSGRPRVPKALTKDEKVEFRAICRQLSARRALTPADGPLIELAAVLRVRWRRAKQKVDETGGEIVLYPRKDTNGQFRDIPKKNMWLDIAETSESKLQSLLDRLGFTPLNRPKVQPTKEKRQEGIVFND